MLELLPARDRDHLFLGRRDGDGCGRRDRRVLLTRAAVLRAAYYPVARRTLRQIVPGKAGGTPSQLLQREARAPEWLPEPKLTTLPPQNMPAAMAGVPPRLPVQDPSSCDAVSGRASICASLACNTDRWTGAIWQARLRTIGDSRGRKSRRGLQSGNAKPYSGSDPGTEIHFLDYVQEERYPGGDSGVVRRRG